MEIYKILDELEAEIEKCARIPLTDKIVIKDEILFDYIDQMRANVPEDMRTGQLIRDEREKIIEEAKAKANEILTNAKSQVLEITDESEITKLAEQKGDKMLESARRQSEELIRGALEYADDLMSNLQDQFEQNLALIKEGRQQIKDTNKQVD
ncbi:hypothetical protein SAMN00017405_0053 [Desulfonispora thiosulfatigenes DSM 11270]|uniref:ATPase n=1 Tax=Desulfonispora thiosulfatigenes DSM 11270 TaxID=656914 RepID=A0A1W1VJV3_DESTI|nr:hypothetical protein [Desulfonispora thiosulfatigenes]SMB93563.1 hypothetical protein SAMN00017405_0053 [Desulfonispora thiosulfatigenes DSM 11270]